MFRRALEPDPAVRVQSTRTTEGAQAWIGRLGASAGRRPDGVPVLILLDRSLPDGTAAELLDTIHSHPWLRRTPVVVFSNAFGPSEADAYRERGADECVTKPGTVLEFERAVAGVAARWIPK